MIYVIRFLQESKFDNLSEGIYEIVDSPEKSTMYGELYTFEAVDEAHFRAYLDWFIWSHIAQEVPSMRTKPELHFEYILNMIC